MAASGGDEPAARTVYIQGRPFFFEVPAQQQPAGEPGELRLPLPSMPAVDWERVLGRNWLAIIGALTLALGIGFFLKLSFDNNWIGDTGRILLGLGAGATLLGLGEFTKRRAPIWSQAVTAGGAATIYMSIYAAYVLYELIRPDAAFYVLGGVVWLAGIPGGALRLARDRIPRHHRGIHRAGAAGAGVAGCEAGAAIYRSRRSGHPGRSGGPELALVHDFGLDRLIRAVCGGLRAVSRDGSATVPGGADGHLPHIRGRDDVVPHQVEACPGLAGHGAGGGERDGVLCADDRRAGGRLF